MKDKFLRVTFSDGEMFDIPADIIAHNRATYYAIHDEGEDKTTPAWMRTKDSDAARRRRKKVVGGRGESISENERQEDRRPREIFAHGRFPFEKFLS